MGKRIKLEISGGETELDKNVTEEIYNPLVHLLRNAIDHGIEFPENRIKSEKNTEGHIKLSAKHEGDKVVISIRDDGRGIDAEQIKMAAIKKGVISELDAAILTKKEIMNLIFHPGFSTADKVTDISGRGVGMDVVKKNVDKLRGTIEIKSEPGRFTEFNIILPLTLAIIQALLVKVGEEAYCIPITSVIETERTRGSEIETIENTEVIRLRDKVIPLLRLSDIFHIEEKPKEENPKFFAVIVSDGVKEAGIVVDSLIGESSIVIKPFEDAAMETEGISGATILGDGRVSLILDVSTLIQFALERKRTARITLKKSESASNVVIDNVQPF
jgi:two-component system chemotaxis sensor kinase CheA